MWSTRKCAAALAAGVALSVAAQRALADGPYNVVNLGLTGPDYSFSRAYDFNASGQAVGITVRPNPAPSGLGGNDAWFFDGTTTHQIGLTGPGYEYTYNGTGGSGIFRLSSANLVNSAGDVVGASNRYLANGTSNGFDLWLYDGSATHVIGLSGTAAGAGVTYGASYMSSSGLASNGALDNAGDVAGITMRLATDGSSLGRDAWLYKDGVTQQIGPAAAAGQQAVWRYDDVLGIAADSGLVVGATTRHSSTGASLGTDAWSYQNGTLRMLGFTGGEYTTGATPDTTKRTTTAVRINAIGTVIGNSMRYNSAGYELGRSSWIDTGSGPVQIGLTGPEYSAPSTSPGGGTYADGSPGRVSRTNMVIGSQIREGAGAGQDAWLYDGQTTRRVGLYGADYAYSVTGAPGVVGRQVVATALNDHGQVTGFSYRYDSAAHAFGQDAWVDTGTVVHQLGLTGGVYETSMGYYDATTGGVDMGTWRSSTPTGINDAGDVIGYSIRQGGTGNSNGEDGWFYDAATGQTTTLQFDVRASDNFTYTRPLLLTDNGTVFGEYAYLDGGNGNGPGGNGNYHLFTWTQSGGLDDLGMLPGGGGLADEDVMALAKILDFPTSSGGMPAIMVGSAAMMYVPAVTATPEPVSLGLVPLAGVLLLGRRRRTA